MFAALCSSTVVGRVLAAPQIQEIGQVRLKHVLYLLKGLFSIKYKFSQKIQRIHRMNSFIQFEQGLLKQTRALILFCQCIAASKIWIILKHIIRLIRKQFHWDFKHKRNNKKWHYVQLPVLLKWTTFKCYFLLSVLLSSLKYCYASLVEYNQLLPYDIRYCK